MTGSMLISAFSFQLLTGVCLWTAYSPSSHTAWESVFYIQHEVTLGWLIRGMHHFMAQAMMILLAIHFMIVVYTGRYRPPKAFSYWTGMALLFLVLAMGFTGYLLVWDQRGRAASGVATNLMAATPMVGTYVQTMAVGGQDFGHMTLTRFMTLHAGVIPSLIVVVIGIHGVVTAAARTRLARQRAEARAEEEQAEAVRQSVTTGRPVVAPRSGTVLLESVHPDDIFRPWWPNQAIWDFAGAIFVLLMVFLTTIHFDILGLFRETTIHNHLGAELGAPADPSEPFDAARPEWYFLFLFQFLKFWESEFIGAILIPGLVATVLFLFPITGAWRIGHAFNCAFLTLLLTGMLGLTGYALYRDANSPDYQVAVGVAHDRFDRARDLIGRREYKDGELKPPRMIPRGGAAELLREDPYLRGPELFQRQCASCHPYYDPAQPFSRGIAGHPLFPHEKDLATTIVNADQSATDGADAAVGSGSDGTRLPGVALGAPNLYRFASRDWLAGLLDPAKIDRAEMLIRKTDVPTTTQPGAEAVGSYSTVNQADAVVDAPYFGNTQLAGHRMSDWVKNHIVARQADSTNQDDSGVTPPMDDEPLKNLTPGDVDDVVAALSAQAQLSYQRDQDATDQTRIVRGNRIIRSTCATWCHRYGDEGQLGLGPDLTGYGSHEWMVGMVGNPSHARFYRHENDRMPAFAESTDDPGRNQLSSLEISMIVDWIRGDYYRPEDEKPVLSHTESQAAEAHRSALASTEPANVIGQTRGRGHAGPPPSRACLPAKLRQLPSAHRRVWSGHCSLGESRSEPIWFWNAKVAGRVPRSGPNRRPALLWPDPSCGRRDGELGQREPRRLGR